MDFNFLLVQFKHCSVSILISPFAGLLLFAVAACWMIVAAVSDIHAPETR